MRAFVAISLPEEIKKFLAQLQNELKATGADVKWVPPNNIHLTLKFLGEIDQEQIKSITTILKDVSESAKQFAITIGKTGAFPSINAARIIWVGVEKGADELKEIARLLEGKLQQLGFPKEEKPFSAHITIGRVRSARNRIKLTETLKKLSEAQLQHTSEFPVTAITLFKSTLTPSGPIYEIVSVAALVKI